jgi:hypothetical protein
MTDSRQTRDPAAAGRSLIAHVLADPPKLGVLAACAVILGFRRAEAWTNPQFWAEDAYFYERAYSLGWHALALPYAGYLHTIPRIIAAMAVFFDPARVPLVFAVCAGALTLYIAARALSERCPLPHFAGLCGLAVVLVPDTREVLLTLVNLQWVLAGGLILLLISRDPAGAGQRTHDALAAIALGLTGPFCIIVAPLFLWRAWNRRSQASGMLAALVLACALSQGYIIHREPPGAAGTASDPIAGELALPVIAQRLGGSIVLGSPTPYRKDPKMGTLLGVATLIGAGYLAFKAGSLRRERIILGLVLAGVLAGALFRTRYSLNEYFTTHAMSRYLYVPQLLAIWLLLSVASGKDRAGRIAAIVLVFALLANIPRLREPAYADMHWKLYAPRIRAGEAVTVPINPPGWVIGMPARNN